MPDPNLLAEGKVWSLTTKLDLYRSASISPKKENLPQQPWSRTQRDMRCLGACIYDRLTIMQVDFLAAKEMSEADLQEQRDAVANMTRATSRVLAHIDGALAAISSISCVLCSLQLSFYVFSENSFNLDITVAVTHLQPYCSP